MLGLHNPVLSVYGAGAGAEAQGFMHTENKPSIPPPTPLAELSCHQVLGWSWAMALFLTVAPQERFCSAAAPESLLPPSPASVPGAQLSPAGPQTWCRSHYHHRRAVLHGAHYTRAREMQRPGHEGQGATSLRGWGQQQMGASPLPPVGPGPVAAQA